MAQRAQRAVDRLAGFGLDALLVIKHETLIKSNVRYLSGFTGTSAFVILTPERRILLTDDRYTEQARAQCPAFEVVQHGRPFMGKLRDVVHELGIRRLGYETAGLTVELFNTIAEALPGVALIPTSDVVESLRAVKDGEELRSLEAACRMAYRLFDHIQGFIRPGVKEKDVGIEMDFHARKLGASGLAFDIIVASGKRSSNQHGAPTDKQLEAGDFLVLDFGCLVDGYRSDMTRTVAVGRVGAEQRKVYDAVRRAQQVGLELLRPGAKVKDVFAGVQAAIGEEGYGAYAGQGIGHGIGLEIHEDPYLRPTSEAALQVGNVVTMEPGIYIPDWGGVRIEDAVVITEDGCRLLTHASKELMVLG